MPRHRFLSLCLAILCFAALAAPCRAEREPAPLVEGSWRAVMMMRVQTSEQLARAGDEVATLAKMGMNVLVLQVPGTLSADTYTRREARAFSRLCREHGVLLVPHWNTKYVVASPKGEWQEQARRSIERIDEIIDTYDVHAMHVGLDEIFVTGAGYDPEVQGDDPAKPFIDTVLLFHEHIVEKRGLTMLMWGDRLIDGHQYDFGPYQSDFVGLAAVIDQVPRNIILCPWHYFHQEEYPSLPMLVEKGFRVLPASHAKIVDREESGKRVYDRAKDVNAPMALIRYAEGLNSPLIIGHLFTTWSVRSGELCEYEPIVNGLPYLLGQEQYVGPRRG
jgi:hypothetical protein